MLHQVCPRMPIGSGPGLTSTALEPQSGENFGNFFSVIAAYNATP